jgi:hypothetical protein
VTPSGAAYCSARWPISTARRVLRNLLSRCAGRPLPALGGVETARNSPFGRFTEFVSACVYGCVGFNRERFHYVYETHLRNVETYFKGRAGDLLVLDICAGEGWERLSAF